ncbi:MAG: DUF2156 domain-containing protein [Candidatus Pacebacteria bacterium]|nr:DUF2156 domain-containing protein [Candidatus Paceibacterota bacterium]
MIPEFPKFKKLELTDRKDIEKFTSQFPHYSDFNFISMWSWDIHNKIRISKLNNNLVVIFNDYLSGENFLSFIGDKNIIETTSKLITLSEKKYKKSFLKLIPEEVLLKYKGSSFSAKSDRDSCDYIYLTEDLIDMKNWRQNDHARRIRKFTTTYPDYIVKVSSMKEILPSEYKKIFRRWSEDKNTPDVFESNEYKAFERFLKLNDKNNKFISVYINNELIGFSVYEFLSDRYAIAHFSKANNKQYPAIYDLLNWEESKFCHSQGVKHLNWEQDLGIPGLRYSKEKYKPYFLMKKLIVSRV